ncbi:Pyridinium-3,5-biscarboxylic acid mononucleotide synthase [Geodia barretti]|uniref:Pyridinium-3,5-biscarboxylic acid mononucleotide synthase n=1 Tax=Geodia barretti TaxID=519541 RepID=A0AA35RRR5_GEOBA|nr:Pyridinium-3,5-biscarboxylic acid mononucleotide synthase [Geodia barretti]
MLHPTPPRGTRRRDIDDRYLEQLLSQVQRGETEVGEALEKLRTLPFEDLGFAKVDHHRAIRTGFPEVVYAPGKTPEQLSRIAMKISETSSKLLITRAGGDAYEKVREALPEARYSEVANVIVVDRSSGGEDVPVPGVLTVAAGTSDLPVAEEAALTAELMGNSVERCGTWA